MAHGDRGGSAPKKPKRKPTPVPISEHAMTSIARRTPNKPPRAPRPSRDDKDAALWTAQNMLPPGMVKPPSTKPGKAKPSFPSLHARVPQTNIRPSLNKKYQLAQQTLVPGRTGEKAKAKLAAAMTDDERRAYWQNKQPRPPGLPPWAPTPSPFPVERDTSFLHALRSTPASVSGTNRGIIEGIGKGLWGLAGEVGRGTPGLPYGGRYSRSPSYEEQEKAAEAVAGRALTNAVLHGDFSHPGAIAAEAALLGLPAVKPGLRGVAAGARAGARGARVGSRSEALQRLIVDG